MTRADHNFDMDLAGRVMAIEQRLKGLHGRTSAIEARLSSPGSAGLSHADDASEDFVAAAAMPSTEMSTAREPAAAGQELPVARQEVPGGSAVVRRPSFDVDATGLIAGGILIGAGLLMYTGNFELIRNPLAAMGCGILLAVSALRRSVL